MSRRPDWFLTIFPPTFPADPVVTDPELLHHLKTVIRTRSGEQVILADPHQQAAFLVRVESLTPQALTVTVLEPVTRIVSLAPRN